MMIFDHADFTQDAAEILNAALTHDVTMNAKDKNYYNMLPTMNRKTAPRISFAFRV
ncbi:MAG: hypothetical protein LBL45_00185 [Treponema sp.]|jgi:hypothetical protein|nr:hypothetical protein [Treponema sp.]